MSLSEWSDARVNCEIETIINKGVKIQFITESGACNIRAWTEGLPVERPLPDYCNNDALAFGLMIDNGIDFNQIPRSDGGIEYRASGFDVNVDTTRSMWQENPNRAIAECLILMNRERES